MALYFMQFAFIFRKGGACVTLLLLNYLNQNFVNFTGLPHILFMILNCLKLCLKYLTTVLVLLFNLVNVLKFSPLHQKKKSRVMCPLPDHTGSYEGQSPGWYPLIFISIYSPCSGVFSHWIELICVTSRILWRWYYVISRDIPHNVLLPPCSLIDHLLRGKHLSAFKEAQHPHTGFTSRGIGSPPKNQHLLARYMSETPWK